MHVLGHLRLLLLLAVLFGLPATAGATPTGPVYPAPGGNGFAFSGDNGLAGGADLDLTGFDFGAFGQLWWGPSDDLFFTGPGVGAALDGAIDSAGEALSYVGAGVWEGTTTIHTTSGVLGVDTRLTVVVNAGSPGQLFDAALVGIDTGITPAVAEVTGDPFSVNMLFEARYSSGGAWAPIKTFFDSASTLSGSAVTSVQGGFWVPEPNLALLLAGGLAFVAAARRRS